MPCGQHRLTDDVADCVNGRVVGLKLLVDLHKSALADFDTCLVEAGISEFGLRPTETKTFSNTFSFSFTSAPSKLTRMPVSFFLHPGTVVLSMMAAKIFPCASAEEARDRGLRLGGGRRHFHDRYFEPSAA